MIRSDLTDVSADSGALTSILSQTHSCALTAACACVSPSGRERERRTQAAGVLGIRAGDRTRSAR
jgi:hypothetical protein